MSISSDGQYIIISYYKNLYLYDINGNKLWEYKSETTNEFEHVSITSDGQYIAAESYPYVFLFKNEPTPMTTLNIHIENNDDDDVDVKFYIDGELKKEDTISSESEVDFGTFEIPEGTHDLKLEYYDRILETGRH
jgi:hypothetical protein